MAADKLVETRTRVLTESLETSNNPRFGYFGYPGPLCIGDDSYAPRLVRKAKVETDSGEPVRNIQTSALKKGTHPNVFFDFAPYSIDGKSEPYQDPIVMTKIGKVEMIDPENKFKPPGKIKESVNKLGYAYEYHLDGGTDPKDVKEALKGIMPMRQIYTNPLKKGGGGVLTGGVLFGFDREGREDRGFPESMPEDYDSAKKTRKKELDEHKALLEKNHPGNTGFKSNCYGNNNFASNTESYHCDVPSHVPRDPMPDMTVPYAHPAAFVPPNPTKKGALKGCCGEFPEWIADPMPQPVRKVKAEGAHEQAFRIGCPAHNPKPTPSVTTLTRNMRSERPSSFARPIL
jgi:hypothetical protein